MSTTPSSSAALQWRMLAELRGGELTREPDEFPPAASEWPDELSRRTFLQLMGASLALAGTGACTRQPPEQIVPYVRQPEAMTLGKPLWFATAMELGGAARGLLVRSNEGRPTKIEGNPDHPATLGRSSVHMQAALLSLYDPERSGVVRSARNPSTWEDFLAVLNGLRPRWRERAGEGVRLLTRRIGSPTLREQIAAFLKEFPQAKWHEHDPAFPASPLPARVHLDRAAVIMTLDAELFGVGGWNMKAALDFAKRRRPGQPLNRLYAIESTPTFTGSMADHRRALPPGGVAECARQLAHGVSGGASDPWLAALVRDLQAHRGAGLVAVGEFQPPEIHALARTINDALGNTGHTIEYLAPAPRPQPGSFGELATAMRAGEVQALFILGPNPVYDTPADAEFAAALARVPVSVHFGTHVDETAQECTWHIPASHFLESWSDTQTEDGVTSVVQPLIDPLYPTLSTHELLAAMLGQFSGASYDIIHAAWQQRHAGGDFEKLWRRALHSGVAPAAWKSNAPTSAASAAASTSAAAPEHGLELIIRPDPHLLDGRFAENAWLQELPKPFTKLTWENAALISPRSAAELKLEVGDVVDLHWQGRVVRAPVWILPGTADRSVTIHLGYGRTQAGSVGSGLGFNAFALQTTDAPWGGPGLEVRKTDAARHVFATTQPHQRMEERAPVRVVDLAHQDRASEMGPAETPRQVETMYPPYGYERPAWGMVIDLGTCIGCSSCTIACQAENNIPVVGREQVIRGREMHWIRVDRYFSGPANAPVLLHQPVPCMHCENAPCELVCPVAATVHDHSGLNLMVYNRCIGTRYCSNNCPYKVRRFNFLAYHKKDPQLALMHNPDVSVRMRGVMEKCTYCVQRISEARIEADKENRQIRDGEVMPACAQACPADAIVFGDINDPASRVAAWRREPRQYGLLAELNTRPRTTYLARLRNPNPEVRA
jgi:molybdopterin-containing oxidoreductase family iron-sulfur binding subunit